MSDEIRPWAPWVVRLATFENDGEPYLDVDVAERLATDAALAGLVEVVKHHAQDDDDPYQHEDETRGCRTALAAFLGETEAKRA